MTVYRRPDPIPLRRSQPVSAGPALRAVRAEQEDLNHLAARQIFAAILGGRFPEGSILPNELALSAQLGVSRTALREAVKGLASKGIVETRRRRGTLVLPRAQWNMLDAEVIGWSRRSGTPAMTDELWEAVAAVLPILAANAARAGAASRLGRAATTLAAATDEPSRTTAATALLLEVARAGRNRFLQSLVVTCLTSLRQDEAVLARRLAAFTPARAARLAEHVANGQAAAASQLVSRALAGGALVDH